MRLLLVEDDQAIIDNLSAFLRTEGYQISCASGEQKARELLHETGFDLLLVDLCLSDGSGFGVFEAAKQLDIPVIFLTASDEESTVVRALDMGAADYISKPFRPRELVSRVRGVLRRSGKANSVLRFGSLSIDTEKASVRFGSQDLALSALEYRLLLRFAANPGMILSRDELLQELWDVSGDYVNDNTLTVYIKRLRDKLENNPDSSVCIQTVRGQGYRLGGRHETGK